MLGQGEDIIILGSLDRKVNLPTTLDRRKVWEVQLVFGFNL